MRLRPVPAGRLLLRLVIHCLMAGVATARIILRRTPPPAGLARLDFAPMSATGAAVLGAMVTLTPGTTAIDIDVKRRRMLLHLLDLRSAETIMAAIRRDFEGDIAELFPEEAT